MKKPPKEKEEEIFDLLGLDYVQPEEREERSEIAKKGWETRKKFNKKFLDDKMKEAGMFEKK